MSSDQFKSLDYAQKQIEAQNYKQSHFTVRNKEELKKDYEDFFSIEESTNQIQ